ncbi:SDR family NAD(P)-dependent oxidoreductase [Zhongshania aliphaticivorans]|uniref:SDR family NAD(P)-dependent oxidoreductase n=1 Tax=Zhongshania aliphaticivorans TaxID=1470434 RepID=UPI0039E2D096
MSKIQSEQFPLVGVALVVGGTGGLGRAIVAKLAANGSSVAFTYNTNSTAAAALEAEHAGGDYSVKAYQMDLMDSAAISSVVESIAESHGGIHTVVYSAGAPLYLRYIGAIEPERMNFHLQSDVMGFFNVVQNTLPHMRALKGAYVACCSCGLDKWPVKDALSVVPKAGIAALVRGIAREEGRYAVRANVIGTGVIDAGITQAGLESGDVPQNFVDGAIQSTPLGRLGEADDIAEAVLFLASQRAKFITGQVLNVDGGWTV